MTDNDFRGTIPGTFSYGVFTAHSPYDLVVRGNRVHDTGKSGKTWRFLVLTSQGYHDQVENNIIDKIGAHQTDTIPGANAPEIILTEGYHIKYEGKLLRNRLTVCY